MIIIIDENSFKFQRGGNLLKIYRNEFPAVMEDEINDGKLNIKKYAYSVKAKKDLKEHLLLYRRALEKYKMLVSLL